MPSKKSISNNRREAPSEPKTEDQLIKDAYECLSRDPLTTRRWPLTPGRALAIGDAVLYRRGSGAKVVALFDEGHVAVVKYRHLEHMRGETVDHGDCYVAFLWFDVLLERNTPAPRMFQASPSQHIVYSNVPLRGISSRLSQLGFNDSPDYQRGYVWTDEDKQAFLASIFKGRDLGRIIMLLGKHPEPDEIFDGKQRMSTLLDLIQSRIAYQGVYWHEMDPMDRHEVLSRTIPFGELDKTKVKRSELLQIFLDVNAGGVPQAESHLDKVRSLQAEALAEEQTS